LICDNLSIYLYSLGDSDRQVRKSTFFIYTVNVLLGIDCFRWDFQYFAAGRWKTQGGKTPCFIAGALIKAALIIKNGKHAKYRYQFISRLFRVNCKYESKFESHNSLF
jgi:FlaA1/EpsC-like NDP-sugar epimerase